MPVMPSARTGALAAEPRSSPRRAPPAAPSSRSQPRMVSAAGRVMVPPRAQLAAPSTSHQAPPATRPRPMPRGRSLVSTAFASLFIVAQSRIYHGETRPVCLRQAGRARVEAVFDIRHHLRAIESLLEEVLAEHARSAAT